MKKIVVLLLTLVLLISCVCVVCAAEGEPDYPQITAVTPIAGGFKISFSGCEGASLYRVFSKTNGDWKTCGTTADSFVLCKGLTDCTEYTFTVRGIDENGSYLANYDKVGISRVYYNPPQLRLLAPAGNALKLTWDRVGDIEHYAVYVKTGTKAWKFLALTDKITYTDTAVVSGKQYTYTVKGVTEDGKTALTYFDESGLSETFVAMPMISSFQNLAGGTKISWSKSAGAYAYRLFVKSGENWKKLADTTACTYTHNKLKSNSVYTYSVRAINKAGKYLSAYDGVGAPNTYFAVPQLKAAASAYGGMKVTWNAVAGAPAYAVYIKTAGGWQKRAVCQKNSYLDQTAVSGKKYTYTVKCTDKAGKAALSYFDQKGVTGTYVAAPEIIGFENGAGSIKITIRKSAGAYGYRYFVKANGAWKEIALKKALSVEHKGVTNNTLYTYTVRAVDKSGKYVSAYDTTGKTTRFLAPPAIAAVALGETQNELSWEANAYAAGYRVYKKTFGSAWTLLGSTAQTVYTDTAPTQNALYTYTLRYEDEAGKAISYFIADTVYYLNGAVAKGKIDYNGKTYYFTDGHLLQGLIKRDGTYYFYNDYGFLQKSGIVGNDKVGYYYADKTGMIDFTFRDGIKQNGTLWLVLNGKAKKVSSEYDKTLYRAFGFLRACTDKSMTKEQKLYASFRYLQKITTEMNPRIPHYTGKNWHLIYANDIFVNRKGNCMSYGAAFAFMARAIGYDEVYCCNSGGHGWAEVNHLVYDPEWDIHHKNSFYGISYDVNCGNDYKGAIAAGYSWMRVKI